MNHSKISQAGIDAYTWENLMSVIHPPAITAQVKNGVVMLRGNVEHYASKVAAIQAVSVIEGVREVICDIQVTAPEKQFQDDKIEKQVQAALSGFAGPSDSRQSSKKAEMEYWELFEQEKSKPGF